MMEFTDEEILTAAMQALRSYQHGNSSPDLAESIADKIEQHLSAREAAEGA